MQLGDALKIPNYDSDPGLPAVESTNVGVALGVASQRSWQAYRNTKLLLEMFKLFATKVDIDPTELAAIEDAAKAGAAEAVAEQQEHLIEALRTQLPQGSNAFTLADIENAVRSVFADAGQP